MQLIWYGGPAFVSKCCGIFSIFGERPNDSFGLVILGEMDIHGSLDCEGKEEV